MENREAKSLEEEKLVKPVEKTREKLEEISLKEEKPKEEKPKGEEKNVKEKERFWMLHVSLREWVDGKCYPQSGTLLYHSKEKAEAQAKIQKLDYILSKIDYINKSRGSKLTKEELGKIVAENDDKFYEFYWFVNKPYQEISCGFSIMNEHPHQVAVSEITFQD